VKLLLDQNLSRHLVAALEVPFPGSRHVATLGLERASDDVVWELAAKEGYVIVTKDSDFYQRSMVHGFPPKVVWLTVGNCRSAVVLQLLLTSAEDLRAFAQDNDQSLMVVGPLG